MKKVLITGGAGFIGSHLTESLLASNYQVRILDDLSTGYLENLRSVQANIEFLQGSVTDPAMAEKAVQGCEVVYHLAALPSVTKSVEDPLLSHLMCATGTVHVLDSARRAKVRRVVFAASSSAYGDQPGAFRKETDPLIPLSPYAAAKLASEHYCTSFTAVYGLETVRLRFFNVFGPRQDPKSPYSGVISLFVAAMSQGRTPAVFGDGLQTRDFVYVENVAQCCMLAANSAKASGKVYNVGMGSSITILDLVRHLNQLLGTSLQPKHSEPRAGDVRHSQADISEAKTDLGFQPKVSFVEGLSRTLKSVL